MSILLQLRRSVMHGSHLAGTYSMPQLEFYLKAAVKLVVVTPLDTKEKTAYMQYSAQLYHWFVRPQWLTKKYIHDHVQSNFRFDDRLVLDFGSGTGANCTMFDPSYYVGIDPDADRIEFAKRLYPSHKFQVFDGNRLPVGNKTMDYILLIAVLHHIPSDLIAGYMKEFERILRPAGTIIVMEPCLCEKKPISNWFMRWYDNGDYIRDEQQYLQLFQEQNYDCNVIKRFRKCFLYHELFFSATPKSRALSGNLKN